MLLFRKRRAVAPELGPLLARLRGHSWKADAERDALLRRLAALPGLEPEDYAWMAGDPDPVLRQAAASMLRKLSWDEAAGAVFPLLGDKNESTRRGAMQCLEALAGASFPEKMSACLEHRDPAVVHAALEYAKRKPDEKYLPGLQKALAQSSPAVRRKAFAIVEALSSPRSARVALKALEDDDEEIRYRAVSILAKHPDDSHVAPLLARCHADSPRVQEAAIAALTPLLGRGGERHVVELLPLLADANLKVRQMAARILKTQPPASVARAFLDAFRGTFGIVRERAVETLASFGPAFLPAFLEHDKDEDPGIAALASSLAVEARDPMVVPHCIEYLSGEDFWLRERAARALAEIKDERAFPELVRMLQDPDSSLSAAHALGVWGAPQCLPHLLEAFKSAEHNGSRDLQLEILDAFSRISDARIPPLFEKISQAASDPLVKAKAGRLAASSTGASLLPPEEPPLREFAPIDFAAVSEPSLADMLAHARALSASDLHLAAGTLPHIRLGGRLEALPLPETTSEQMDRWLYSILDEPRRDQLEKARQIDFCHKDPELGRFRTNVFHQRKGLNAVFRLVPWEVPTLADIDLPESLWELTTYSQGLVLVTGPAGCGKTTTLAALVNRINETERSHILTVEDPIEYVHRPRLALINQREVPSHTRSFAKALRQALREDPDVILVGEMRDLETVSLAITASETGHLVLATLHTTTASATVDRVINSFPAEQQGQIRMMIADSLKAVVSQALLPRRDGSGRVAAFEVLRNTPNVAGLIREGKTFQIPSALQTGAGSGMQLMDTAMLQLVQNGVVDPRAAYDRAQRKETFEPYLTDEGSAA
ncbi:MAG TPA: PilT/PilU family type 4a pilus ATPase [Thermoanaerobaculia bacterium]